MNAVDYLKEWERYRVWEKYSATKHQERFQRISFLVVGSTFLDVGCAFGHSTHILASLRDGKWSGLDFWRRAALEAKRLFSRYNFYHSPDYNMAGVVGYRSFDSVVCAEVIEHVKDDRAFVEQLLKLAGHRIVLTTPSKPVVSVGHLRCYTEKALNRLLEGLDYEIKKEEQFFYITINNGG